MIAYIDSSILLRLLLNQPGKLAQFSKVERPVSSKLLKPECLRALDRARLQGLLDEDEHLLAIQELYDCTDSIELIEISDPILERVGGHFATPLGTLDAIHLCSALAWREQVGSSPTFLTHDEKLGRAAKFAGLETMGTS